MARSCSQTSIADAGSSGAGHASQAPVALRRVALELLVVRDHPGERAHDVERVERRHARPRLRRRRCADTRASSAPSPRRRRGGAAGARRRRDRLPSPSMGSSARRSRVEQQRILAAALRKHALREAGDEHDAERAAAQRVRRGDEDAAEARLRRLAIELSTGAAAARDAPRRASAGRPRPSAADPPAVRARAPDGAARAARARPGARANRPRAPARAAPPGRRSAAARSWSRSSRASRSRSNRRGLRGARLVRRELRARRSASSSRRPPSRRRQRAARPVGPTSEATAASTSSDSQRHGARTSVRSGGAAGAGASGVVEQRQQRHLAAHERLVGRDHERRRLGVGTAGRVAPRHLAEGQVLGEAARREVVRGAGEQRQEGPAGRIRASRAAREPRGHLGPLERLLERAPVGFGRANHERHLVERHATRRLVEDPARDLDGLAGFPRRREELDAVVGVAQRRDRREEETPDTSERADTRIAGGVVGLRDGRGQRQQRDRAVVPGRYRRQRRGGSRRQGGDEIALRGRRERHVEQDDRPGPRPPASPARSRAVAVPSSAARSASPPSSSSAAYRAPRLARSGPAASRLLRRSGETPASRSSPSVSASDRGRPGLSAIGARYASVPAPAASKRARVASASAARAVAGVTPRAASVAVAIREASWPSVKRCRPKVAPRVTATPRQKSSAASRVAPTTRTSVAAGQSATKAAAASSRTRADADTTARVATVPLHYRRKMPVQVGAAARKRWGDVESEPRPAASKPAVHPPDPPIPLLAEAPAVVTGRASDWWASLNDEQLLDVRMCDLHVTIEGSKLVARIAQLHAELENRKLAFEPHYWLSDEWFTPDGVSGIAIPFYLAHPRLEQLEERQMLEVEGGTHDWCMKILRHEAGHAIDNAYQLQRRRKRLKLFGLVDGGVPGVLHAQTVQQELRPAPRFLVRAEPSRRGLRRDVRGVAQPALAVARALRRLAGAEEARVHGRADARPRRASAPPGVAPQAGAAAQPEEDAAAALRPQARALRLRVPELLRPRSAPAVHRGGRRRPRAARRPRVSSAASARTCAAASRAGPASTTTPSTASSRT